MLKVSIRLVGYGILLSIVLIDTDFALPIGVIWVVLVLWKKIRNKPVLTLKIKSKKQ